MTDPWARPADEVPPPLPEPGPGPQPQPEPSAPLSNEAKAKGKGKFRDPLSIVLVVVIVAALSISGLIGSELIARRIADSTVSRITSCVVQDTVDVSFGPRPFLLQHFSKHYRNITATTAGNRIREAEGMKARILIDDIRVTGNPQAPGTIGALDAMITWSADGIKRTIQNSIPLIGSFVTSVSTNKSAGTVELEGALGSIVAKPTVANNQLSLTVQNLTGLGFVLPRESVQPALDAFIAKITGDYPMGIHADSVEVTDSGVIAKFSARNGTMPAGTGKNADPCFAGI